MQQTSIACSCLLACLADQTPSKASNLALQFMANRPLLFTNPLIIVIAQFIIGNETVTHLEFLRRPPTFGQRKFVLLVVDMVNAAIFGYDDDNIGTIVHEKNRQ